MNEGDNNMLTDPGFLIALVVGGFILLTVIREVMKG